MAGEQSIVLPDGRSLAYRIEGVEDGMPLLFCHGAPGSDRALTPAMVARLQLHGWRAVVPARPGYGRSDPDSCHALLAWAEDAACLLDALAIRRTAVLGYSAGAAYALACATRWPGRVAGVTLVGPVTPALATLEAGSGISPAAQALWRLAREAPMELAQLVGGMVAMPERLLATLAASVALPDRQVLEDAAVGALLAGQVEDSLSNGGAGLLADYRDLAGDWGFAPEAVRCPVTIWQGVCDCNAPPGAALAFTGRLPQAVLHRLPGAGHLCLYTCWPEILAGVMAAG